MPFEPGCIEKHRTKEHLECNVCSENRGYLLHSLPELNNLSEEIIKEATKYPEWLPHLSKLAYTLTLAIHETCMNAVEHGLLGLNKEQKKKLLAQMQEKYLDYVQNEWKAKNAPVHVSVCLNSWRILIGVHDDGAGFDFYSERFSPIADSELMDFSGRGLVILEGMGMRLYWNRNGNTILCSFIRPDITEHAPHGGESPSATGTAS